MLVFYFLNFSGNSFFLHRIPCKNVRTGPCLFCRYYFTLQKSYFSQLCQWVYSSRLEQQSLKKDSWRKLHSGGGRSKNLGGPLLICCRFLLLSSLINLQNLEGPWPLPPLHPLPPSGAPGTIADQSQSQSLFEIDKDKACLQVSLGTFQSWSETHKSWKSHVKKGTLFVGFASLYCVKPREKKPAWLNQSWICICAQCFTFYGMKTNRFMDFMDLELKD